MTATLCNGGAPRRHVASAEQVAASAPEGGAWRSGLEGLIDRLPGGFLAALLGNRGTGKTQLAVCLMREAAMRDRSRTVRYVKAADLFRELRHAMHEGREVAAIKALRRVSLLVIDEAHERGNTDYEDRTLTGLLDHRYDDQRATLLVSNQTAEEFAASMGSSVVSRITETGSAIVCDWPSFRVAGGAA